MSSPNLEIMTELLEAGVHYGHQTKRWNPKMRDFILEEKNSIYIIDLSIVGQLAKAASYLGEVVKAAARFSLSEREAGAGGSEAAEVTGQFFVKPTVAGRHPDPISQTIQAQCAPACANSRNGKAPAFSRMNKQETLPWARESRALRRVPPKDCSQHGAVAGRPCLVMTLTGLSKSPSLRHSPRRFSARLAIVGHKLRSRKKSS